MLKATKEEFVISLDIGGTHIKGAGLIAGDQELTPVRLETIPSGLRQQESSRFIDKLINLIQQLSEQRPVTAIGISTAGRRSNILRGRSDVQRLLRQRTWRLYFRN